jgi:hypothetical protein
MGACSLSLSVISDASPVPRVTGHQRLAFIHRLHPTARFWCGVAVRDEKKRPQCCLKLRQASMSSGKMQHSNRALARLSSSPSTQGCSAIPCHRLAELVANASECSRPLASVNVAFGGMVLKNVGMANLRIICVLEGGALWSYTILLV